MYFVRGFTFSLTLKHFFRLLPDPDKDLLNILEKKEKELELVSLELIQAKDTIGKLQMEGKYENAEQNIIKLEHKLKLTDNELNLKEKLLFEAEEKCSFSQNKLIFQLIIVSVNISQPFAYLWIILLSIK